MRHYYGDILCVSYFSGINVNIRLPSKAIDNWHGSVIVDSVHDVRDSLGLKFL